MKFHFHSHQGKSDKLIEALVNVGGFRQVHSPKIADVIFTDVDIGDHAGELEILHKQRGKKIMVIPHAGMPNFFGDFPIYKSLSITRVQFVPAVGHVEVMRAWGYDKPLEIIGWYFCPLVRFRPRFETRKVLFAPIHPNADNTLSHVEKQINAEAYKKLLALVDSGDIRLTVRYLRGLENNGLWNYPGVKYVAGKPDQTTKEIDESDIVVSKKTMQYMAVARGVPCVGMGEHIPPPSGSESRNNYMEVQSWDKYRVTMAYPIDILAESDTLALLNHVAVSDGLVAGWRQRMIGEAFSPEKFVELVKKYL